MSQTREKRNFILRAIIQSAKTPIIYFLIGCSLFGLTYLDRTISFSLMNAKGMFIITDKIGNIFIGLAFITFIYNFIVIILQHFEKYLLHSKIIASLIIASVRKGLRIIYVLIVLNLIIVIFEPTQFYLSLANIVITSTIIASIGWIVIQIIYTFEAVLYQRMLSTEDHEHPKAKALYTRTHILRNVATVIIIILTISAILMSFSSVRNIGISILASAGFLTAIIGLAAQKTLFSVFSGLQIAMSQSIKLGDMVVVEGESGLIEEVTFTFVALKLADRRRMMVPISYFIDKPFENWSRDADSMRSSFSVNVDFLMPIEPLREELNHILQSSLFWDGKAQKLQVNGLGEKSVELRVQVSAANADNLSDLRAEVREKLLAFMRDNYPEFFPNFRIKEFSE